MTDLYTKAVLTVIAVALVAIVVQQAVRPATAQLGVCGSSGRPCVVEFAVGEAPCGKPGDPCVALIQCGEPGNPCSVRIER